MALNKNKTPLRAGLSLERDASENNPETNSTLLLARIRRVRGDACRGREGAGFRRLPTDFEEGVVECRATASLSGVRKEHSAPFASDPVTRAGRPPCTRFTRDSRTT